MFDHVSVLVPVFNNAETLQNLAVQVTDAIQDTTREITFVFVDDASQDKSLDVLREMAGTNIRIVENAKNIGQQASIHKGLALCQGQVIVVMDADLQDPPEAIPHLLRALQDRASDVAFGVRVGTYQSTWRMLHSRLFRFVIRRLTNLPQGAGGFVAMTADVARDLARRTSARFYLAGLIGCGGYRIRAVPIERNLRQIGQSAYTRRMRLSLGLANLAVVLNERMARGQR